VGPFFWLLARQLRRQNVEVHKVNMNGGDALFFPGPAVRSWRGRPEDWPDYLAGLIAELDIDAIALFGDCRLHHRQAIAVAGNRNIPVFVFEEGYLRPDHITVELGGVNGSSPLMGITRISAVEDPGEPIRVGNSFPKFATWAVLYLMAKDAGQILFRHYRHHRGNCIDEGLAHLRWGLRKLLGQRRDRRRIEAVSRAGKPYFLLPLQVHFDSQITAHSPFLSIAHMVTEVIRSFAAHAPLDAMLLIKHHPLDRGHCCYRDIIERAASAAGCADRVIYFADGHLPSLLDGAVGTVTCNSTVGLSSLWHGAPVKVLGRAIYDRPGLTAQCPLDGFWSAPQPVNRDNVSAFAAFLRATCQANGSFYTGYSRTGVLDTVIARMADQYEYAIATLEIERSHDLPIRLTPARTQTGGGLVPSGLSSTGAKEGAE
jgi:capsule polysaccharide modification protein KpsS